MDRSNQLLLKNHALHKLIPIVLQLMNQIKQKFSAKSCSARAIFLKLLWGRGWVAWKYSIHFKLHILQLIIDCSVGKKAANLFKRRLFWTDWDDCYRSQIPPLEKARTQVSLQGLGLGFPISFLGSRVSLSKSQLWDWALVLGLWSYQKSLVRVPSFGYVLFIVYILST